MAEKWSGHRAILEGRQLLYINTSVCRERVGNARSIALGPEKENRVQILHTLQNVDWRIFTPTFQ